MVNFVGKREKPISLFSAFSCLKAVERSEDGSDVIRSGRFNSSTS